MVTGLVRWLQGSCGGSPTTTTTTISTTATTTAATTFTPPSPTATTTTATISTAGPAAPRFRARTWRRTAAGTGTPATTWACPPPRSAPPRAREACRDRRWCITWCITECIAWCMTGGLPGLPRHGNGGVVGERHTRRRHKRRRRCTGCWAGATPLSAACGPPPSRMRGRGRVGTARAVRTRHPRTRPPRAACTASSRTGLTCRREPCAAEWR